MICGANVAVVPYGVYVSRANVAVLYFVFDMALGCSPHMLQRRMEM